MRPNHLKARREREKLGKSTRECNSNNNINSSHEQKERNLVMLCYNYENGGRNKKQKLELMKIYCKESNCACINTLSWWQWIFLTFRDIMIILISICLIYWVFNNILILLFIVKYHFYLAIKMLWICFIYNICFKIFCQSFLNQKQRPFVFSFTFLGVSYLFKCLLLHKFTFHFVSHCEYFVPDRVVKYFY